MVRKIGRVIVCGIAVGLIDRWLLGPWRDRQPCRHVKYCPWCRNPKKPDPEFHADGTATHVVSVRYP